MRDLKISDQSVQKQLSDTINIFHNQINCLLSYIVCVFNHNYLCYINCAAANYTDYILSIYRPLFLSPDSTK